MTNEFRQAYELKLEDLIPYRGIKKYLERCVEEIDLKELRGQNTGQYKVKSFVRSSLLGIYNLTIFATPAVWGISKLFKLVCN
jgi:hypothetical protein